MYLLLFFLSLIGLISSGCSVLEQQNAKIKTLEQKVGEMEAKVQAVDTANQELGKRIEQVAGDKSTERRLTYLEEKQSSMEKMQLELVRYQDSLRNSISKVKGSVEELKDRLEEVRRTEDSAQKQTAGATQEAAPPAKPRPEEKSSGVVEIEVKQKTPEKPKEKKEEKPEPRGFILEEF
jgi:outer membrane murein-binding lipoprotein Lpp